MSNNLIKKVAVTNNVTETGSMNDLVSHIENIEIHPKTYVLRLDKPTHDDIVVRRDNSCYTAIRKNGLWDETSPKFNKRNWNDRVTWFFPDWDGCVEFSHSDVSLTTLLPVINEIIDNSGDTRNTYTGVEGNHMIPKNFGVIDNSEDNLELCSKTENCRHFPAWAKVCKMAGQKIKFRLSALDSRVDVILDKHTKPGLVDLEGGHITLLNSEYGNITINRNSNGVWK